MTAEVESAPVETGSHEAPSGMLGSDAVEPTAPDTGDWRASLPEDLKSNPKLQAYKTPADLAKAYANLNKLAQSKGVTAPAEDASPEEWTAYYAAQGRPDAPDKYNFNPSENTHLDDETIGHYRDIAFKSGLSERQFQNAMKAIEGSLANSFEQQKDAELAQRVKSEEALKKEWGEDWKTNAGKGWDYAKKMGILDDLLDAGLGSNHRVLKALFVSAQANGEDTLPDASTHNSKSLDDQISDIRKSMRDLDAKNQGASKEFQALQNTLTQLNKQKYGGS